MGSCLSKEDSGSSPPYTDSHLSQNLSLMSTKMGTNVQPRPVQALEPIQDLIIALMRHLFKNAMIEFDYTLEKIVKRSNTPEKWLDVVTGLLLHVPMRDPTSSTCISMVMSVCPAPTPVQVVNFIESHKLSPERCVEAYKNSKTICFEKNLLNFLGCVAEKYAGDTAKSIFTNSVYRYLITFLTDQREPCLVLFSLIALEKFAATADCKRSIDHRFLARPLHPLVSLESRRSLGQECIWQEVGFCTQWLLDNIFIYPGRPFAYESLNMETINVIMDVKDATECMKISADGLEIRSDDPSMQCVRATFEIKSSIWYYEAVVVTAGSMQIGWASKVTKFMNCDKGSRGKGVFCLAYDGFRGVVWSQGVPNSIINRIIWQPGDVLGCLIDVGREEALFSQNGQTMIFCSDIFRNSRTQLRAGQCNIGLFPAANLMAHQQCRFNFGAWEFLFPPNDKIYRRINQHAKLSDSEKQVIPRGVRRATENEADVEMCLKCANAPSFYALKPCGHSGFCQSCAKQLLECPLCRVKVVKLIPPNL